VESIGWQQFRGRTKTSDRLNVEKKELTMIGELKGGRGDYSVFQLVGQGFRKRCRVEGGGALGGRLFFRNSNRGAGPCSVYERKGKGVTVGRQGGDRKVLLRPDF